MLMCTAGNVRDAPCGLQLTLIVHAVQVLLDHGQELWYAQTFANNDDTVLIVIVVVVTITTTATTVATTATATHAQNGAKELE